MQLVLVKANKMVQKTFCLSSKSFQSQLESTLKELFTENTFADVTLVSDDQIQIPAHKFVLHYYIFIVIVSDSTMLDCVTTT